MNFPSQIFFNDINHGYKTAIMEKNSLWLFLFYMAVATFMKSFAERCALQLYHAFLKRYSSAALYCEILTTPFFKNNSGGCFFTVLYYGPVSIN